jgi:UDP-2-acetamido-3-amino-2,3-dideoxy-glucuronate N-acetyltransferase
MKYKVHILSDVQSKYIGQNTTIWQFVVILAKAIIGENCNINCNVFIENDVVIGNNVTVKSGVQLWDGLIIKDDVFIGPNVTFTNDNAPRSKKYPEFFKKIIVGKGASIGANSTIIGGVEIGDYALIGAGSIVTKSVPPYTLWYGNPAIHRGYITKKGKLLSLDLKDENNKQYKYINNILKND